MVITLPHSDAIRANTKWWGLGVASWILIAAACGFMGWSYFSNPKPGPYGVCYPDKGRNRCPLDLSKAGPEASLALAYGAARAETTHSGNPILSGWYADPEARVFAGQYWIFPTYSAPYNQQTFLDAFSSRDLITTLILLESMPIERSCSMAVCAFSRVSKSPTMVAIVVPP